VSAVEVVLQPRVEIQYACRTHPLRITDQLAYKGWRIDGFALGVIATTFAVEDGCG
jgi:hypothetical protein